MSRFDYDVAIVGSGFGGSVAALRAAEKGYRVGVMESGKRWKDEDLPKSQWHLPAGDTIPNGSVVPFYIQERRLRISVARLDDRIYAFNDICTCADEGCPLSGGLLTGTTILCQCHGSRFDITTGAVVGGPATEALNVHEVREVDSAVQIRV
jgi:3-phenylpropionate/trans-cinnamate dioxygenase ferredoxin component